MIEWLVLGFLLGAAISLLAWRAGALSRSGALAAAASGGLIFGLGGLSWAVLLLGFFISSSALSRAFPRQKAAFSEKYAKGARRDWGQVLANGGLGALLAIAKVVLPGQDWIWFAFVGAMAAVNGDTWATELGVLSKAAPRLITSGKSVEKGVSGGVSLLGYLAVGAGALIVGVLAALFSPIRAASVLVASALAGGLAGSTFDSFLGATVQAIYYCPNCQKETERHPLHTCGSGTRLLRGWPWLNNDLVNFACSVVGAMASVLVWGLFL